MNIPMQLTWEGGLEPSEALQRRIEHEAEKLERFHDRIIGLRVAMIGRSGRRRQGAQATTVHLQGRGHRSPA